MLRSYSGLAMAEWIFGIALVACLALIYHNLMTEGRRGRKWGGIVRDKE